MWIRNGVVMGYEYVDLDLKRLCVNTINWIGVCKRGLGRKVAIWAKTFNNVSKFMQYENKVAANYSGHVQFDYF